MRKSLLLMVFILLNAASTLQAQSIRDQDLVTLKNGYQVLGYIMEQRPGKSIKLFRPLENDTVEIALPDVSKLNKIWVQPFSELNVTSRDTIIPGRYNNKKNVFSVGYVIQWRDIERRERRCLSLSWHRSRSNRHLIGLQAQLFGRQNTMPRYAGFDENNSRHEFIQYQFYFSNQFRLGKKVQNRRVSTLLSINAGYAVERSVSFYNQEKTVGSVHYERAKSGFLLHTGFQIRINPDNQSGFILEPGYTYLPQMIYQYSGEKDEIGSFYLGFRNQVNHLFTLKMSYFF
jgi:hypothetical protein